MIICNYYKEIEIYSIHYHIILKLKKIIFILELNASNKNSLPYEELIQSTLKLKIFTESLIAAFSHLHKIMCLMLMSH